MMSFRPCVIAAMLSLGANAAIDSAAVALGADPAARAKDVAALTPDEQQFFEKQVRPLLIKHCYQCHSSEAKVLKGGLHLDSRAGWMKGGDSGPAIVLGEPDKSLLIEAIRFESLEMPPSGKAAGLGNRRPGEMGQDGSARSANRSSVDQACPTRFRRGPFALVVSTDHRTVDTASEERFLAALGR
jgi:hypothetical protein